MKGLRRRVLLRDLVVKELGLLDEGVCSDERLCSEEGSA
jgi:hypothetical protein